MVQVLILFKILLVPKSARRVESLENIHPKSSTTWYITFWVFGIIPLDLMLMMQTSVQFSSVQSLSRVWLFATPWTATCQASLSITNSQSLLKLVFIEFVMPSNHRILCHPLLLLPSIFPSIRWVKWVSSLHQVVKELEFELQHQSFQSHVEKAPVGSNCSLSSF